MAFKLRSGKTTTFKAMGSRPLKLKDPEDKEKIELIQPPKRSNKSFGRDTEEAVKTDPTIDTSKMYNRNLRIDEKLTDDSGTGYITKQNISREEWDKKPSQPHYKTTDKPIMTEFGTSDAVYVGDGGEVLHRGDVYDDDGNIIKGAKQKYMGPVGGFDESETLRIGRTQGRSQLGLKPESTWNPSSPQSETFLRLLTQPKALRDMFNVDRKISDEIYLGEDTSSSERQQDAIYAAVNSLLNTKMDKSQTGKYAYDESRLPYEMEGTWKDVNILDVIKKLGK